MGTLLISGRPPAAPEPGRFPALEIRGVSPVLDHLFERPECGPRIIRRESFHHALFQNS